MSNNISDNVEFRNALNVLPKEVEPQTPLPRGVEEFHTWADRIIDKAKMPNNDSIKFTLAVMVLHLDSTTDCKEESYFVKSLSKAASNQVVSQIINEYKQKQAEEQEKLKQAQLDAEATAKQTPCDAVPTENV